MPKDLEIIGEESNEPEWKQIIHNECGLPVEFCECPNAKIKYNHENDTFIVEDDKK